MKDNALKLESSLANQGASLTIFDAPNVCRGLMAKCQSLANHPDPEVVKTANEIGADAKKMLDAIVASVDDLLALQA